MDPPPDGDHSRDAGRSGNQLNRQYCPCCPCRPEGTRSRTRKDAKKCGENENSSLLSVSALLASCMFHSGSPSPDGEGGRGVKGDLSC
jgi:hypothetical protein